MLSSAFSISFLKYLFSSFVQQGFFHFSVKVLVSCLYFTLAFSIKNLDFVFFKEYINYLMESIFGEYMKKDFLSSLETVVMYFKSFIR